MFFVKDRINSILRAMKEYAYSNTLNVTMTYDDDSCYKTKVVIPDSYSGETVAFCVNTGNNCDWDNSNPQFVI